MTSTPTSPGPVSRKKAPAKTPPEPSSGSDTFEGVMVSPDRSLDFPAFDRCGHPLVPLSDEQVHALLNDLNQNRIAHRSQGGAKLSYLEAWDVKATLTRVFGFGGWSAELLEYRTEDVREVPKSSGAGYNLKITVSGRLRLHIHQLGAWYTEASASSQTGPDYGDVLDFALKTAESDALKRAAIALGTQFGLSLYDNGAIGDVIRVVLAPEQKGARERHAEALRAKRADPVPERTEPISSPEAADSAPEPESAPASPPAQPPAPPTTADAAEANIDWAKEAALLGDVEQVRELYKRAARAGAAPMALKAIEARGAKLAALQEPVGQQAAEDAAIDQLKDGFKQ